MCFFKRYKIRRLEKKLKALQHQRLHNPASSESIKKEVTICHELATLYGHLKFKKKYPYANLMVLEAHRAATSLDNSESQYQVGNTLLELAKFREKIQQEGIYANSSNERQVKQNYEEAHAYLLAADKQNHIEAKRLRGLCYINGWGYDVNQNTGFELVVASIELENSWDRVPQIFSKIGLNKPEFFSLIMKMQREGKPNS